MKKFAFTSLKIFFLLIFVGIANSCFDVSSQSSRMHEVENKSQTNRQASAETLAVFREFFAYVQTYEPSIATDEIAQNRWLTKRMRKAFVEHIGRSGNPEGNPDYPTNATFVLVWNRPTTYSIVGSRQYDFRNKDNPNDNRAQMT